MDSYINFDLTSFVKKWKIIAAVAVLGVLISYCYATFFSHPAYWCSRAYTIDNTVAYSNDDGSRQASINDMNVSRLLVETYTQLICLDEMMSCLSDYISAEYGLDIPYRQLGSYVSIQTQGTTEIMRIFVTTRDPQLSRIISDSIDVYLIPLASDGVGSAEIISQGRPLDGVQTPGTVKTCIIGLFIGVILGAGIVFLISVFNDRVTDEEEFVKKISIPVLGSIPEPTVNKGGFKYGK